MRTRFLQAGLGQTLPTGNPATATCYSAELNEQLIAACEAGSPVCTPQTMARLLNLPYCPGECGTPAPGIPGSPSPAAAPGNGFTTLHVALGVGIGVALGYYLGQDRPSPRGAAVRGYNDDY